MAIIHQAELQPTKLELLQGWLPRQPWFTGDGAALIKVGAFRFDDPEGEVGIETILVAADGSVFQVPLSYQGSPLHDAETVVRTGALELLVIRRLDLAAQAAGPEALTGTWAGQQVPVKLAAVTAG